ncbi:putative membrane protein [Synechococcus sp. Minos11]|nr:putative membrane protein [Synechococcus sp. Minos11]
MRFLKAAALLVQPFYLVPPLFAAGSFQSLLSGFIVLPAFYLTMK